MKQNMKHYFINWECDTPQDDPYAEHEGMKHIVALNHEIAYRIAIKSLKQDGAIKPRITHIEELEEIVASYNFVEVK